MQKYVLVHLVDLFKSFHKTIYYLLAKSASVQPRTSLSKCKRDSIHFSIHDLGLPVLAERGDRLAAEHVGRGPLPGGQVREAWCGANPGCTRSSINDWGEAGVGMYYFQGLFSLLVAKIAFFLRACRHFLQDEF